MAKILIYAVGSPTSVKIGDTDTDLYLQIAKDNVAVDLTAVKSITVKIADTNKNYLKDISINPTNLPDGDKGILVLPLNSGNVNGFNSGDYYFEVWIVTADNETEIYPDMNVTKFHVFNNIVGGTTVLTTLTMQAFLDKVTANQVNSETSLTNSEAALTAANTANANATKTLNDLNAGNYLTKDNLSSAPSFSALQTQVNNSAVGTNLLLGTSGTLQTVTNASGWNNNIPTYWPTMTTTNSVTSYTARVWIAPASYDMQIQLAWKDKLGNPHYDGGNIISAGASGYSTQTSVLPAGSTIDHVTIVFIESQSTASSVSYKEMKLEKGDHATDHSLNPTEILTQSDYSKIKAAIVALGGSLS